VEIICKDLKKGLVKVEIPPWFFVFRWLPGESWPTWISMGREDKSRMYGNDLSPPPELLQKAREEARKCFLTAQNRKHITGIQLQLPL